MNNWDLSSEEGFAYILANTINSQKYSDLLIIEFHEEATGDINMDFFNEFKSRSERFYSAFMNPSVVDNYPAIIHLAVKISNEWILVNECGYNYYLGYGPTGILLLRKACKNSGIKLICKHGKLADFFEKKSISVSNSFNQKKKDDEYENIISKLVDTCREIERRKAQYSELLEENIRDRMLTTLNPIFNNRVSGEAKNVKGKTDILIKSENLKEQFIFELKIWRGISDFESDLNQLLSYLTWHDNMAGMIIFSHLVNFTKTITDINNYFNQKSFQLVESNKNGENEIRGLVPLPSDTDRLIQIHIILVNLK